MNAIAALKSLRTVSTIEQAIEEQRAIVTMYLNLMARYYDIDNRPLCGELHADGTVGSFERIGPDPVPAELREHCDEERHRLRELEIELRDATRRESQYR